MRSIYILSAFALLLLGSLQNVQAQCSEINFTFTNIEPCRFRLSYSNTTECYNEIRLLLDQGEFVSYNVNAQAGFSVQQISPSELWITHSQGFLPLGTQFPINFVLPYDLTTSIYVAYINYCPPGTGCELFPAPVLESCPDPQNASIIGTKYRECGNLPFTNQPAVPDWVIQLQDEMGNVLAEQQTDGDGRYAFYDLPLGLYRVKELALPGWTPVVPATGEYLVDLLASQQVVRNFGNCPGCSCDSIFMDVTALPGSTDSCEYIFSITKTSAFCYNNFSISLASGTFADITPDSGWDLTVLDSQNIQLAASGPPKYWWRYEPCKFRVHGAGMPEITTTATFQTIGPPVTCSKSFVFACPPPVIPLSCCPAGSQFGPELIANGDFELGNQDFNSNYSYFNPGNSSAQGKYSVLKQSDISMANMHWSGLDHTAYSATQKTLCIDGIGGQIAWQQSINVTAGTTYSFSAWFDNLTIPIKNYDDPQVALFVGNTSIAGPLTLKELPDIWERLCGSWTATSSGPVLLSIQVQGSANSGNDFAVDDVSFRSCITSPPTCNADFSVSINCGNVTLTNQSTGTAPITPLWSNGSSSNTLNLQLPCGTYTYCLSFTDAAGCTSSVCKTFTVSDNTPPIAKCLPGFGVTLGPNCQYTLTSAAINDGSTDDCQIQSITVSPSVLTGCGNTTVTLTVTDWCGNKSTCMTGVQTGEDEPPMIKCPPDIIVQGDPDVGGIQIQMPYPDQLNDNCPAFGYVTDHDNGLFPCGSSTEVTYTAIDGCGNTATCTMNVIVEDCEPEPVDTCCAFALHFVNKYNDGRIKYVRVTGLCDTKICCTDPDEWAEETQYPYNVVWRPADGSPVPFGNAIDNDFLIYLSEAGTNSFQVEWIDQNEIVVARHTIDISCDGMFDEDDEDWTKYTSITALDDPNLFVFAVRETSEDGESDCEPEEKLLNSCSFTWGPITCSSPNYLVPLQGPSGYASYNWSVVLGPSYPSLSGGQNTNFLGMPGSYVISVQATDAAGKTCSGEEEIILPDVQPDFTWKFLDCPNNTAAEFTAGSLDDVTNISWSTTGGTLSNSSSNPTTITFPSAGTYTVYLSTTDIYGCTHTVSQSVTVDLNCKAGLEVEKFVFCPDNCAGANTAPVTVTFSNLSTGGKCPVTYKWDFGDGNSNTVTNKNDVPHTYNVPCPGGKQYSVTLTMTDADNNTCTETIIADITPCEVDFTYIICPDGKVIFEGNHKGKWSFPGSHSEAPWPYSDKKDKDDNRKKVVVRYDQSGTYGVTFTGVCDNGGECTIVKEIVIVLECCAKNDRKRDKFYFNGNSGGQFKMKYKFAQNQLPFFHHIKAKTWLKKKKTKAGISYWKNFRADEMEAALAGTVYKRDADKCNCKVPFTVPYTSSGVISAKKAKAKYSFYLTRFRSRKHTLTSTHYIKIESAPVTKQLLLGEDCDKFRWWLDWF